MEDKHVASAYWVLRIAFGVVPIAAGLDKFTNLLADWQGYLSPFAARLLPVSPGAFMHLAGIVEIAVGVAILAGYARVFGYVAMAWLAAIAVELLTTGHFLDVAARDVALAAAAFALGRLAQVHEVAGAAERSGSAGPARAHA
jgi:uncharacterized membrane protein YphA (DoxX/SURF4 family)